MKILKITQDNAAIRYPLLFPLALVPRPSFFSPLFSPLLSPLC